MSQRPFSVCVYCGSRPGSQAIYADSAKRLGADVVNLEMQLSSRVKGESMLDTVFTLESLHVDVFVVRDKEEGVPALVAVGRDIERTVLARAVAWHAADRVIAAGRELAIRLIAAPGAGSGV